MAHGRDLTGQVALITGANSGVGWQTARTLALQGCQVLNHPPLECAHYSALPIHELFNSVAWSRLFWHVGVKLKLDQSLPR